MKILVTGGAGFIGSHVVDELIKKGHQVAIIDNLSSGHKENLNPKAKFYQLDIRSSKIKDIFKKEKFDAVFHLAAQMSAQVSVKKPIFDAKVNVLGMLNLLENALVTKVNKFIFSSSGGVLYGEARPLPTKEIFPLKPICPYGVSKLTGESYLRYYFRNFNFDFIALRYGNVYGPRQDRYGEAGVVALFIGKMQKGEPCIIYGDGKQTRDYVFVKDIARANTRFLEINTKNWQEEDRFFNVGRGKETTVKEIHQILSGFFKAKEKPIYEKARLGDIYRSALDPSKIKKLTHWSAEYDLKRGLEETVKFFKNRGSNI